MIAESLIFQEDDRSERPFIICEMMCGKISKAWFTIFNMESETPELVKFSLINLSKDEFDQIESIRDVKLTPSSSAKMNECLHN